MCASCKPQGQGTEAIDELDGGLRALEGLCDLLNEAASQRKRQYQVLGPDGLAELVFMVAARLERAGAMLQHWTPPAN